MTTKVEAGAAKTAAAIAGMTSVWHEFLQDADDADLKTQPSGISARSSATHSDVGKKHFECYMLAAAVVRGSRGSIPGHIAELKKLGVTAVQLRDVGGLAAAAQREQDPPSTRMSHDGSPQPTMSGLRPLPPVGGQPRPSGALL
ncbi:hypothetical protein ABZ682_41085 [Streptomyces griseoviridis]|uniref:hypothetical protein n=1 Tax=Streptomyces TaxID=1883 RepID=UPI0024751E60|nr:hypothetical protein [Streptomyces sp. MAA16]MDH6699841.1 putative short-subunit dehydrogenase-like oxidoreductase (DUF2520 family) [Streptomyces sp. MAA16]